MMCPALQLAVQAQFLLEEIAGGPLMKLNFTIKDWVENKRVAFSMISGTFVKLYEQILKNYICQPQH